MSFPEELRAFQRRMLDAVRETGASEATSASGAEAAFATGPLPTSVGLGVYRRGYRATMGANLERLYPSVREVVGDEIFRWLCVRHVTASPATHPNLSVFGEEFASRLRRTPEIPEHEMLADLADLEWAWHRLRFDSAGPPEDPRNCGAGTREEPGLRLVRPARLIESRYPLLGAWIISRDRAEPREADLEGLCLILWRRGDGELRADRVSPGAWSLLEAAATADPERLLAAVDQAVAQRGEEAVTSEITAGVRRGWFVSSVHS